jgi:hypothetical protein
MGKIMKNLSVLLTKNLSMSKSFSILKRGDGIPWVILTSDLLFGSYTSFFSFYVSLFFFMICKPARAGAPTEGSARREQKKRKALTPQSSAGCAGEGYGAYGCRSFRCAPGQLDNVA